MPPRYPGFPAQGLTFLRQLARNNERDWFDAHRARYAEHVRAPTRALVEALNTRLVRIAPEYVADPQKAVTRIQRDGRFHAGPPYWTSTAARFTCRGGRWDETAGFFVDVTPRGVHVLGGARRLTAAKLAAVRRRLAKDPGSLTRLVRRRRLVEAMGQLQGAQLARAPKGWPADHPAIDLLRRKQLYFQVKLPAALTTTPELVKEVAARMRLMTPFVRWLDEAMNGS